MARISGTLPQGFCTDPTRPLISKTNVLQVTSTNLITSKNSFSFSTDSVARIRPVSPVFHHSPNFLPQWELGIHTNGFSRDYSSFAPHPPSSPSQPPRFWSDARPTWRCPSQNSPSHTPCKRLVNRSHRNPTPLQASGCSNAHTPVKRIKTSLFVRGQRPLKCRRLPPARGQGGRGKTTCTHDRNSSHPLPPPIHYCFVSYPLSPRSLTTPI